MVTTFKSPTLLSNSFSQNTCLLLKNKKRVGGFTFNYLLYFNYRPISVLPFFSRYWKKLFLIDYIKNFNIQMSFMIVNLVFFLVDLLPIH